MRPYSTLLLGLALVLPALAGCSNKATHTYVLTADVEKSGPASPQGMPIGVGPVTLPKYLDRLQMVTRSTDNSLDQADLDQWGGDLSDNITRVLAINLANLLKTDRVSLYPWTDRAPMDYQVTVQVANFEQQPDGTVELDAFWSLLNPSDGKVLIMRRSSYRETGAPIAASSSGDAATRTYDAVAAAMSRDLAALSRDIANEITSRKGK
jgi:uncharacterized lipoprotein YmbA